MKTAFVKAKSECVYFIARTNTSKEKTLLMLFVIGSCRFIAMFVQVDFRAIKISANSI